MLVFDGLLSLFYYITLVFDGLLVSVFLILWFTGLCFFNSLVFDGLLVFGFFYVHL